MSRSRIKAKYDVVVLGAGHNGLVAASYLGRAGLSVLLLEKRRIHPERIQAEKEQLMPGTKWAARTN